MNMLDYMLNEMVDELSSDSVYMEKGIDQYNGGPFGSKNDIKGIRELDLLKKKYDKGSITKEDYEKKVKEIKAKSSYGVLPDKISSIEKKRPESSKKKTESLKSRHQSSEHFHGELDDITFEKFNRHYKICRTTDNYNEYKQHFKELCRILGCSPRSVIGKVSMQGKKISVDFRKDGIPANVEKGSILYHTSDVKNISRLNGTFRAKDGVLYPTKRVYFMVGKPGSRYGIGNGDSNVYEYTGDVSKCYIDSELRGGKAVYIETETSIPVKMQKK